MSANTNESLFREAQALLKRAEVVARNASGTGERKIVIADLMEANAKINQLIARNRGD